MGSRDNKVDTSEWAAGQESGYLGLGSRDMKVGTWDWAAGTRKWVPESGQQGQVSGYLGVGSREN